MILTFWHRLDRLMAKLRPHREPLVLLVDALMVVLAWNITYLFRVGFDRWLSSRSSQDAWVMAGVVVVYFLAFSAFKVPSACKAAIAAFIGAANSDPLGKIKPKSSVPKGSPTNFSLPSDAAT